MNQDFFSQHILLLYSNAFNHNTKLEYLKDKRMFLMNQSSKTIKYFLHLEE